MSASNQQSPAVLPSTTATPPPNVPYATKELAKKWLEDLKTRFLPANIHEKVNNLDKRINTKGKPWDDLKQELDVLNNELLHLIQQQQQLQLQRQQVQTRQQIDYLEVGIPAPVLRDTRVDALVQKYQELEITSHIKEQVTTDMEKIKERLKYDVDDNLKKIRQLRSDLADKDKTIDELENKLKQLAKEKEELEKKITSLEGEIKELKSEVGSLQITVEARDAKIEKLLEIHSKNMDQVTEEATQMKSQIQELETRNEQLEKMTESRIMVGETMKLMIKEIYKHVHPTLKQRKINSYNVRDISEHLDTKYRSDPNEKTAAQNRWEKLKADLGWNEDIEDIIHELIVIRNQTAHPIKPPTNKIEFRDALRQMKEEADIEDDDEGIAYGLYLQCKKSKLNI